jgi:hypothetical protein
MGKDRYLFGLGRHARGSLIARACRMPVEETLSVRRVNQPPIACW